MLRRRISLLQAISLNMAMMVGIGPFITIPEILAALGGPHAMIGWALGALVAWADGLVWSELAAAFPGSGGTYHYFDAVYGEARVGRALKFLFVWQFLFSAPLEIASGAIGIATYAGYLWPSLEQVVWRWQSTIPGLGAFDWRVGWEQILAMGVMLGITILAYRRIEVAARLMVVLWLGMLATVAVVIVSGLSHFDVRSAFALPAGALRFGRSQAIGLGTALSLAMYSYLGYYQVCYLGDEVADPPRTIPRSITVSVIAIAVVYITMNASVLGVIPWREAMVSKHIASDLMFRLFGVGAARAITLMIIWTAAAAAFAGLLGYSRVPYAAARSGHFFRGLARTHPTGDFPDRSLILVGGLGMLACLADLATVIQALLTSRILIQFVAQIVTVFYIRTRPDLLARLPFRMAVFPLPAVVALAGWLYIFGTSKPTVVVYGTGSLILGFVVFCAWDWLRRNAS